MKNRIIELIRGSFLLNQNSSKNWSFIIFFSFLSLLMIYSSHSVDKKIYKIAQINENVKSLRSQFVDTRTILMKFKMESTVSNKLDDLRIISSANPPVKIIIKE
ncbi:MAG: S-adenosyl-methyltransferase [Flavobacteriaceae bacterium]|jgi:hypothetical protein|nr:S-adenosyl-methyltransferase [Flavobacteriaceae bacterium]